MEQVSNKKTLLKVVLALVLISILGLSYYIYKINNPPFDLMGQRVEEVEARNAIVYSVAQTFVLDTLKSPASAEFPSIEEATLYAVDKEAGIYYVESHVDSQNSYGAMLRSAWDIEITHTEGDFDNPENWTAGTFMFDGEFINGPI